MALSLWVLLVVGDNVSSMRGAVKMKEPTFGRGDRALRDAA
jgi:hypothetical protein